MKCRREKCVVLAQIERAEFRSAYIGRIRQYGVEDRLKLARRGTDYLEDVGGRGLLFQRFTQLVEQPRILDRDHRLVGKDSYQFDLLVGERFYSRPRQYEDADHNPIA